MDVRNDPLYPFGYGLSYTTFKYSDIRLSRGTMTSTDSITATVTVRNTGSYDADEIVQLYIHDKESSSVRPVKELKGFQRIHLTRGESKEVTFTITPSMLSYYDYDCRFTLEPGQFDIMIGTNSTSLSRSLLTVE